MKNLKIIKSQEYRGNQPSVFTEINGKYVGCLSYPRLRNYPNINCWSNATSSDSDRGFEVVEKSFNESELNTIEALQVLIASLTILIPQQPHFPYITSSSFKIRRGKAYEAYKTKKEAQEIEIKNYFASINVFDAARTKAENDLRNILNK